MVLRCARCEADGLEPLPPNEFSRLPGYRCPKCNLQMLPPGSTLPYILVTILGGTFVVGGMALYVALQGGPDTRSLAACGGAIVLGLASAGWAMSRLSLPTPKRDAAGTSVPAPLTTTIQRAAANGDVGVLAELVASRGADVVRLDHDPQELTSLHLAAAGGHVAAVEYLLSPAVGADPRAARINNFTPLHSAAMKGHARVCEILLRAGARIDVQTVPQGYAALHSAAFAGHVEALRVLLRHGANRTLVNYRKERPADTARRQGQIEAARLLDGEESGDGPAAGNAS